MQADDAPEPTGRFSAVRAVLLTNFIPPYRAPLFRLLARQFGRFEIYVSTRMEPNRRWRVDWAGLDVTLLPGPSLKLTPSHPHDFASPTFVHLPFTAVAELWRSRPDVVISGQLGLASALAAVYCLLRRNTALVLWLTLSEISELARGPVRRRLRKWLLGRADAVMVNGESGARYARTFGVDESKLFRVHQAVDNDAFAVRRPPQKRATRRVAFVGGAEPRKGLRPFLAKLGEWAASHPHRGVELRVAGRADAGLEAEARRLPANVIVTWLGDVDYDAMPSVYAGADILAFPTLCDEWGLVANEAMAAGAPVIGSVFSQAVEELIEDGRTGWCFRPDRDAEYRDALERAFGASAEEIAAMGEACRARVAEFSFDRVAERMLTAIAHALEQHRRHTGAVFKN